jgi:hypothetical protein
MAGTSTARRSSTTAGPQVFISYRREDSKGFAIALKSELARRYGDDRVFMDLDNVAPGELWEDVINQAVGSCDVLVALIGKRWLSIRDTHRRRRIDNPQDPVRLEIATALARKVKVIPALLEGARMPEPHTLPQTLARLPGIQALTISDDWRAGMTRLIEVLDRLGASKKPPPHKRAAAVRRPPPRTPQAASNGSGMRERFVRELKRRGYSLGSPYLNESSPNIYYADEVWHSKPRIVIRGNRVRIEKNSGVATAYRLWKSFSLNESTEALAEIDGLPRKQRP